MEELIIKMYKQGVSISGIVDKILKLNKNFVPIVYSFNNYSLYEYRNYNRYD